MLGKAMRAGRVMTDQISNALVQASAFYVVSHERSGTHFLINFLNANLPIRVGLGLGSGSGRGWNNIGEWFGPYDDLDHRFDHIEHYKQRLWYKGCKRNAIIKTHATSELFNEHFRAAPIVYIYRDPRDVMVSWFHYLNNPHFYQQNPRVEDMRGGTFSEFLRRPVNDFLKYSYSVSANFSNVVERWADHVSGWLSKRNVCVIRYEELAQQPKDALQTVAAYLGISAGGDVRPISIARSKSMLPRKGVVGDWVTLCSPSDLAFMRKCVEKYGLDWRLLTQHEYDSKTNSCR